MTLLRAYLILGWLLLAGITAWALTTVGPDGGKVFFTDFTDPWRASFNTDFLLHVIPFTAWVIWREPSKAVGLLCGIGTLFGGMFTLIYLLVATYQAGGDARKLMLGKHA
jgi:hypothetical protein